MSLPAGSWVVFVKRRHTLKLLRALSSHAAQVLERLLSDLHVLQQSTASRQHPHDAATVAAAGVDHLELSRLDALMAQVRNSHLGQV